MWTINPHTCWCALQTGASILKTTSPIKLWTPPWPGNFFPCVSPKLFSHWLKAHRKMFNEVLCGDGVARSGSGLETAWLSIPGKGWVKMINTHQGLHATVRSNRLDVQRATWMSLKTMLSEKIMQKKKKMQSRIWQNLGQSAIPTPTNPYTWAPRLIDKVTSKFRRERKVFSISGAESTGYPCGQGDLPHTHCTQEIQ